MGKEWHCLGLEARTFLIRYFLLLGYCCDILSMSVQMPGGLTICFSDTVAVCGEWLKFGRLKICMCSKIMRVTSDDPCTWGSQKVDITSRRNCEYNNSKSPHAAHLTVGSVNVKAYICSQLLPYIVELTIQNHESGGAGLSVVPGLL